DHAFFMLRLQFGCTLQYRAAAGREPQQVRARVGIGLAPADEAALLEIRDGGDEIRLLNAKSRRHPRLARARILVNQYQYGELPGPQVELAQRMEKIRKDGVLRPAQCIAHVAAEWRQLHSFPSPVASLIPCGAGRVACHLFLRRQPAWARWRYSREAAGKTRRRGRLFLPNDGQEACWSHVASKPNLKSRYESVTWGATPGYRIAAIRKMNWFLELIVSYNYLHKKCRLIRTTTSVPANTGGVNAWHILSRFQRLA